MILEYQYIFKNPAKILRALFKLIYCFKNIFNNKRRGDQNNYNDVYIIDNNAYPYINNNLNNINYSGNNDSKNNNDNISKYQNFMVFGLSLFFYDIFFIFFIFEFLFFIVIYNYKAKSTYESWEDCYSINYKCLQIEFENLLNKNYTFNITCIDEQKFFYISKFGVSPINKEGENIAGCFSKSFKNLIEIDEDCDLSDYLEEKLKDYKYKEINKEINMNEMKIDDEIKKNVLIKTKEIHFFYLIHVITLLLKKTQNYLKKI
jgi:hypothetical protein